MPAEPSAGARAASAPPHVVDRTVVLRGGAVELRVRSAGQGPPLLYLHSVHERGGWSPFLDRLASRHTVHAPLHPGVGGSTGVETLDDLLDLVLVYDELLDALGLGTVALAGHGEGAMVAAELAAVFPRRATRLVLVAPFGLWTDEAPTADVLILPPDELRAVLWEDPEGPAARAWAILPTTEAENVEAQLESIQRRAAMAKFVWPIPDNGIRKRLHRIAAPTLLLWGDGDRANPVVYAEEWRGRLAKAEVQLVPGGHMVQHEAADTVAALVAAFLRR